MEGGQRPNAADEKRKKAVGHFMRAPDETYTCVRAPVYSVDKKHMQITRTENTAACYWAPDTNTCIARIA